jgi:hypothetical protein
MLLLSPRLALTSVTGARGSRRELLKMLDAIAAGDVVTVR